MRAAWLWLKLYGGYVVSFVVTIVAAVFLIQDHSRYEQLSEQFQAMSGRHRQELEDLRKVQDAERVRQQQIETAYRESLARIEAQRATGLQQVETAKKTELRTIVEATHDNPAEMARRVNELFGLPIQETVAP